MPPQKFQNLDTIHQVDNILMVLRNAVELIERWKPYKQSIITDCLDYVVPEIDIAKRGVTAIIKRETKRSGKEDEDDTIFNDWDDDYWTPGGLKKNELTPNDHRIIRLEPEHRPTGGTKTELNVCVYPEKGCLSEFYGMVSVSIQWHHKTCVMPNVQGLNVELNINELDLLIKALTCAHDRCGKHTTKETVDAHSP